MQTLLLEGPPTQPIMVQGTLHLLLVCTDLVIDISFPPALLRELSLLPQDKRKTC